MTVIDRQRVLEVAEQLVESDGPDRLTITAIARCLGVTQPALYHHVDGLDDVRRGLGLIERRELAATLADACLGLSGPEAVRAVADAWRRFGTTRPGLYRVAVIYPVAGDPDLEAAVDEVVAVLDASLRGFGLNDHERAHAALMLRSALHGFVSFELAQGHPKAQEPDDTFAHIVELLIVGFHALADGSVDGLR